MAAESIIVPPPPPPARGGNAPACGRSVLANEGFALLRGANVDEWLRQTPGLRQYPIGTGDARTREARRDPNLMNTSSVRDVVPWQFHDVLHVWFPDY